MSALPDKSCSERRRAKRLRRAEDELADAEERLHKWGFGMKPSEYRRAKERVDEAKTRLAALSREEHHA